MRKEEERYENKRKEKKRSEKKKEKASDSSIPPHLIHQFCATKPIWRHSPVSQGGT